MQVEISYPDEVVAIENGRIWDRVDKGDGIAAENALCEMVEALAIAMARAEQAHLAGDLTRLVAAIGPLRAVASTLGLEKLASVADSVAECADRSDWAGTAATLARMSRLGDKSLSVVWNLPMSSG
ncbi:MAG: hypothetical protein ACK5IB_03515 [Qingshengfaniella sp.]